ncbi:hypothetical protein V8E51_009040 [Hyaloscypha variabilis]
MSYTHTNKNNRSTRSLSSVEWPLKEKIIVRAARGRAHSGSLFLNKVPGEVHPLTLANSAFDAIIARLREQHLWTSRIIQGHFHWLLPRSNWTPHELAIFCQLQVCPMIITDADLSKIIKIELSTAASPKTSEGQHFYFRSWTLTAEELYKVLDYMTDEDDTFAETANWKSVLAIHDNSNANSTTYFTIRYVEKCAGPKRPYDRFVEDLKERTNGILHEFMRAVETLLPEVAKGPSSSSAHLLIHHQKILARAFALIECVD